MYAPRRAGPCDRVSIEVSPSEIRGYAAMFRDAAEENQQNMDWLNGAFVAPVPPKPTGMRLVRRGREQVVGDAIAQGNMARDLLAGDTDPHGR